MHPVLKHVMTSEPKRNLLALQVATSLPSVVAQNVLLKHERVMDGFLG